MSDFLKRSTMKWGKFWITVALYLLGQLGADLLAWLNEIGEQKFTEGLSLWAWLVLTCKMVISAVFVLKALRNGTYQEAKRSP
jgi:hypothetical protein